MHDTHKIEQRRHDAARNHEQHGEMLIHVFEQPVERQHQEDQQQAAEQVTHHTDAESSECAAMFAAWRRRRPDEQFVGM